MPVKKEPANSSRKNGSKALKKLRLKRLFFILTIIFVFLAVAAAITTYAAVQHFMKDLPAFNVDQLDPAKSSFIYDKDGQMVTPLMGVENRILVTLDEMSQDLIDAFIAIEDDRFYDHPGFDARGIFRAVWNNVTNKSGNTQGGSTITQQLVKNTFLTPERTIKRKVQEVYMAYQLEQVFSKDEILEFYLNRIFFDYNAYGVEAAAQTYFGKSANEVTLAEAAMLAGIPNLPGKYSPYRNFEEAKRRQKVILARMVSIGKISQAEADEAAEQELVLAGIPDRSYPHPWFVDNIIHYDAPALLATLPDYEHLSKEEIQTKIYTSGLHIYTTLDQRIQQAVSDIMDNPDNYRRSRAETQAALVVAQPQTGYVTAIVGGRNYKAGSNVFNRAVLGKFQAGSVLKPLVAYGPAFNEGLASPGTVLDDSPGIFPGTPEYMPNNFDMTFLGLMTARQALATSRNLPAVSLLSELGVSKGKEYAMRMGITGFTAKDNGLAMVVGGLTEGVNPWQTAQAYAVLANEGVRTDFTTITKIVDSNGKTIYEHVPNREEILTPEGAWLTTSVLTDTVLNGSATYMRIGRPLAAKTGTSDKKRDAWMAAYTPDYVAVFWIGEDPRPEYNEGRYESFYVIGSLMNPILKAVHEGLPVRDFTRPSTLKSESVCKKSGLLPGQYCPPEDIITDWFLPANIPIETCSTHVMIEICSDTDLLAGEFCPASVRVTKAFYNRPPYLVTDERWLGDIGRKPADAASMPPTEVCTKHTSRPQDISSLKTIQNNATGEVLLTWSETGDATGYLVARKGPEENKFTLLTETPIPDLMYLDRLMYPGTYSYSVTAVNAEGTQSGAITTTVIMEPPPSDDDPPE